MLRVRIRPQVYIELRSLVPPKVIMARRAGLNSHLSLVSDVAAF